jgi:DMSO reductase anchor subunit
MHRFVLLLLLVGIMLCCLVVLLSLPLSAPEVSDVPGVASALAGANVGHVDRGANAPAPLPDGSYPLTLAEELQQTDRHPVNAYLLTMLMLACSFGASVLRMLLTNARRQEAISSWIGDDRRWLSEAYEEPSFLGVFRL